MVGMLMLGYAIYSLRVAEETARESLDVIKDALEA
jgi:hypothetical protein